MEMSDGEGWGGTGEDGEDGEGRQGGRGEGRMQFQGVGEERRSEEHKKKVITADGEMNMVLQEGSRRAHEEGGGRGGDTALERIRKQYVSSLPPSVISPERKRGVAAGRQRICLVAENVSLSNFHSHEQHPEGPRQYKHATLNKGVFFPASLFLSAFRRDPHPEIRLVCSCLISALLFVFGISSKRENKQMSAEQDAPRINNVKRTSARGADCKMAVLCLLNDKLPVPNMQST